MQTLSFGKTFNSDEIVPYLVQLDQRLANGETTADTTAVADTAKVAKAAEPKLELNANKKGNAKLNVTDEAKIAEAKRAHPLLQCFKQQETVRLPLWVLQAFVIQPKSTSHLFSNSKTSIAFRFEANVEC